MTPAVRSGAAAVGWVTLALALAFWPVWVRGHGLRASLGAPGVTDHGPVAWAEAGTMPPPVPVADGVAAYIDEPLAVLVSRQLGDGEAPLWNPHNGLGVPLLGNWQTSVPNPLRVPVHVWPRSGAAWDATYLLRLLIAGTGAALLALRLGLGAPGALAAGVTFGLSGYFVRYLQMHHLNAEVWLPWLWLAADALARRPRVGSLLGFVFVVYAVVTGGNPQPMLVAAVASLGFAAWRLRAWGGAGLSRVALAALPPVLVAAPYWLAGLEYVGQSVHHHSETFGGDAYTAAGALGFLLPAPLRRPEGLPYWSEVAPWLGALPLALALVGLGRQRGRDLFLAVLLLLTAGKIGGLWGTQWLGALPGFELMKLFKYLYPPAALALALLAAAGVQALGDEAASRRRLVAAAGGVAALLAVLVVAALGAAGRSEWLAFAGWWQALLVLALLGALVAAHRLLPGPRAAALAAGLAALELVVAAPGGWVPRREPFAPPAFLAAFRGEEPGTFRTFGAYGMWMPNQNAVFGIDDVRLHDGVFPARYGAFVRRFLEPNVRHWPVFTGEDLGTRQSVIVDGLRTANLLLPQQVAQDVQPSVPVDLLAPTPARYLDLVNVRYLVLPGTRSGTDLRAYLEARVPPEDGEVAYADDVAVVFERHTALPRAWLPRRLERVADADEAFARMERDDFDGREVAYLETEVPLPDGEVVGAARVLSRPSPGELVLQVQSSTDAWVVASILPYPGVRAEVVRHTARRSEPEPAPLVPADGTLSAVAVPRGRCEVRITYEPTWNAAGWWLALLGAAGLVVLAVAVGTGRIRGSPD